MNSYRMPSCESWLLSWRSIWVFKIHSHSKITCYRYLSINLNLVVVDNSYSLLTVSGIWGLKFKTKWFVIDGSRAHVWLFSEKVSKLIEIPDTNCIRFFDILPTSTASHGTTGVSFSLGWVTTIINRTGCPTSSRAFRIAVVWDFDAFPFFFSTCVDSLACSSDL